MDFSILSKYDDFLANYFLDNLFLWFPTIRMNSDMECGTVDTNSSIPIIRQRVVDDLNPAKATKELIQLPYFQEFLKNKQERQISEFSQHMRRYMCMFMPNAGFEVSSTTRYTGKLEACIVATQDWKVGQKVTLCQGSIAKLTAEEDERLKSEGRDFSVMVSTRKKCACLFLGPARFMNHDCDANCEFILIGSNAVTFKVNKDIKRGDEMTVFYGKHYFGEDNCECLCASCERRHEGSFSKSEKTVITDTPPVIEEDIPITRRSNRKRKEKLSGHNYELDKRLRNVRWDNINSNEQSLADSTDGNQRTPEDTTTPKENTLQNPHITYIQEDMIETTRNIESEGCVMSDSNCNSVKEILLYGTEMSNLDKEQDNTEIEDISTQLKDTFPVEINHLNMDGNDPTNKKESSSNNEVSTEIVETHILHSPENDSKPLEYEDNHEGEKSDQEPISARCLPDSNVEKKGESIVPNITGLDEYQNISREKGIYGLSEVDNNSPPESNRPLVTSTDALGDKRIAGRDNGDSQLANVSHNTLSKGENATQENSTNVVDDLNDQLPVGEEITLSEGYEKVEIVFSEGISEKRKTLSDAKQRTQLFKGKDKIRQVRSVVIGSTSRKVNLLTEDSLSTVCDIWIPVSSSIKKQRNTDLQELKNDIQKKNNMEIEINDHLSQDIIAGSSEKEKESTQISDVGCKEIASDEHEKIEASIHKDESYHDWSKSASPTVCNTSDFILCQSETASTCSINMSDNSYVFDKSMSTSKQENNDHAPVSPNGSLQTSINETGLNKLVESKCNTSSNDSSKLKSRFIELVNVPEMIVRRGSHPKTTDHAIDFSYAHNLNSSKLQLEKNEIIALDDLSRSFTSSSNDSVSSSSNVFDAADISSPISILSNDTMLTRQEEEIESYHGPDSDFNSCINSVIPKNPISKATSIKSTDITLASTSTSHVDDSLSIPAEYDSTDASLSDSAQISRSLDIFSDISDSIDYSFSTSKSSTSDSEFDHFNPVDPIDTSITLSSPGLSSNTMATSPISISIMDPTDNLFLDGISSDSITIDRINTENMGGPSNSPCIATRRSITLPVIKQCCPEFSKYNSEINTSSTMCPRCYRHLHIFGIEWPKRIARKRNRYKHKGVKSNQRKEFRTKPTIQKQLRSKNAKQKIGSTQLKYASIELDLTSNSDVQHRNTKTTTKKSEVQYLNSLVNKDQERKVEILPQSSNKFANKNQGIPRKVLEKNSQSKSTNNPEISSDDNGMGSLENTLETKPEKPKAKRPSYYYEIVIDDGTPKQDPIISNHPSKPYPLRIKSDNNDSHQAKSTPLESANNGLVDKVVPKKKEFSSSTPKRIVKKANQTRPRIRKRPGRKPHSQQLKAVNKIHPDTTRKSRKKTSYYYYTLVLEDEETEKSLVIGDLDGSYRFRSRDDKIDYSDTSKKQSAESTSSKQPSTESKKQVLAHISISDESSSSKASDQPTKITESISNSISIEDESEEKTSPLLNKSKKLITKTSVKEKSKKTTGQFKKAIDLPNIQSVEEEIPSNSSIEQKARTKKNSDLIPAKKKSDKKEKAGVHLVAKENRGSTHKNSSKAIANTRTQGSVTKKSSTCDTQNSEETSEALVLLPRNTRSRSIVKANPQSNTKGVTKSTRNQQKDKPEENTSRTAGYKTRKSLGKRSLDKVEKSTYELSKEPQPKRYRRRQSKKEDIVPTTSKRPSGKSITSQRSNKDILKKSDKSDEHCELVTRSYPTRNKVQIIETNSSKGSPLTSSTLKENKLVPYLSTKGLRK